VLDDRLDEERRVVEAAEVGDHLDTAGVAAFELARGLHDRGLRALGGFVRAGPEQNVEFCRGSCCEATRDRAGPGDAESFSHGGYSTGPFIWMTFGARPYVT